MFADQKWKEHAYQPIGRRAGVKIRCKDDFLIVRKCLLYSKLHIQDVLKRSRAKIKKKIYKKNTDVNQNIIMIFFIMDFFSLLWWGIYKVSVSYGGFLLVFF
jgi:hypothetical protein